MPDIKCPHCGSYNNIREVVTRCLECNNNLFNQKTENMKATLENFLVKWDGENPLWREFMDWMNKGQKSYMRFTGSYNHIYYGFKDNKRTSMSKEEITDTPIITLEQWKELLNQKTNNMNNVFKKGDRVYHIHHGWGEVESVERIGISVWVNFEKDKTVRRVDYYFISFTEYRLEGFSQQRPFEPEIGKFYWFWDEEMKEKKAVIYGKLGGIYLKEKYPYYCIGAASYTFISDKNPLE